MDSSASSVSRDRSTKKERVRPSTHLGEVGRAASISLGTTVLCIILQGATIFHDDVAALGQTTQCQVVSVFPNGDSRQGLVTIRTLPEGAVQGAKISLARLDLSSDPPHIHVVLAGLPHSHVTPSCAVAWDAHNDRAYLLDGRHVWLVDSLTSERPDSTIMDSLSGMIHAVASDEGRSLFLAVFHGGEGELVAVDQSSGTETWRRKDLSVASLYFDPTRNQLICGGISGRLSVLNAATGETVWEPSVHASRVIGIAVSAGDEFLASIDCLGGLQVHDLQARRRLWSKATSIPARPARFLGLGSALAVAATDVHTAVAVFDAGTGAPLARMGQLEFVVQDLYPVSGDLVYVVDRQGGFTPWYWRTGVQGSREQPLIEIISPDTADDRSGTTTS